MLAKIVISWFVVLGLSVGSLVQAEEGSVFYYAQNGRQWGDEQLGIRCFGQGESTAEVCATWAPIQVFKDSETLLSEPKPFSELEVFNKRLARHFPDDVSVTPLIVGSVFGLLCALKCKKPLMGVGMLVGGVTLDVVKAPVVVPTLIGLGAYRSLQEGFFKARLKRFLTTPKLRPVTIVSGRRYLEFSEQFHHTARQ